MNLRAQWLWRRPRPKNLTEYGVGQVAEQGFAGPDLCMSSSPQTRGMLQGPSEAATEQCLHLGRRDLGDRGYGARRESPGAPFHRRGDPVGRDTRQMPSPDIQAARQQALRRHNYAFECPF